MERVKPTGQNLLVLPIEEEKKSIILTSQTISKINPNIHGVVLDKGIGTKHNPLKDFVNNGKERIVFPRNAGVGIEINGVMHRIIDADDVIGILT